SILVVNLSNSSRSSSTSFMVAIGKILFYLGVKTNLYILHYTLHITLTVTVTRYSTRYSYNCLLEKLFLLPCPQYKFNIITLP
ncbi:hypothetical protein DOY81_010868, partial [Sarcophaga bullata]